MRAVAVDETGERRGPEEQEGIEEDHQERGFGEEPDHHLAACPKRAEGGADIHGGEREEDTRRGEEADERNRVGGACEGRSVTSEGMIAAASTIVPNNTYGVGRKRGEASVARAASLWKSLRSMR